MCSSDLEMIPDFRFDLLTLANQIKSLIPNLNLIPSVLAHGDLHLNQVLLTDDTPYLLDFDRAGRGYAGMDLGSIMEDISGNGRFEHLAQHLVESYQTSALRKVTAEEILIGRSIACLRKAFQPFRSLSRTWQQEMQNSIEHCESLLRKGGV